MASFTPPIYDQSERGENDSDCAYFSTAIAAQYVMQQNFNTTEDIKLDHYLAWCPIEDSKDEGTTYSAVIPHFKEEFADTVYENVQFEDNMRGAVCGCSEMIKQILLRGEYACIGLTNMEWGPSGRFVQGRNHAAHNICVVGHELYGDDPDGDGYFIIHDSYPPHRRTLQFSLIDKTYLRLRDAVEDGAAIKTQAIKDDIICVSEIYAAYQASKPRRAPKSFGRRNPPPLDSAVKTVKNAVVVTERRVPRSRRSYGLCALHDVQHYGVTRIPQHPKLSCRCET